MLQKLRGQKGFTLIELMIVVAIIGILAAIAIPNFLNYQCKAKQSEAKANLGNIRTSQEAYFAEYDTYADEMSSIGFATKGNKKYTYYMTSADSSAFTAGASTDNLKGTNDVWTIDEDGVLTNVTNACTGS